VKGNWEWGFAFLGFTVGAKDQFSHPG